MNKYGFPLVLVSTFVTFCAFYAPQPLLPLFTREFAIGEATAALLITVTFVLLCVGPLATGAILRHTTASLLLIWSLALLGCLQIAFGLAESFTSLLIMRTGQACLYPIIFTSAVTYCSQTATEGQVARRVSFYIATTVLGGLGGRIISGYLSTWFSWSLPFLVLGVALLVCAGLLGILYREPNGSQTKRLTPVAATSTRQSILKHPTFFYGFALIFTTFFSFAALLNVLPFRMVELDPAIASSTISLVYFGYLPGAFLAASSGVLVKKAGSPRRLLVLALAVFLVGYLSYLLTEVRQLILLSCINAGGFFLLHATLSSYLNSLLPAESGRINGWYISVYYAAGALGSWLPVIVYTHYGWTPFLSMIALISALGFISLRQLQPIGQTQNT